MSDYFGSCHCGHITFKIEADITELTTCDCSICVKKNAVMTKVHESQFKLLSGQEVLREYQWNTKVAKHYFCGHCGIYIFHRKRAQPDHFGINIFCLDAFDPSDINVRETEGENMTVVKAGAQDSWPGPRIETGFSSQLKLRLSCLFGL